MGIAKLVCFVADPESGLRRLPPGESGDHKDIWVLIHPDLKNTQRVRSFMEFLARAMGRRRDLVEGRCGQRTWQPPDTAGRQMPGRPGARARIRVDAR